MEATVRGTHFVRTFPVLEIVVAFASVCALLVALLLRD